MTNYAPKEILLFIPRLFIGYYTPKYQELLKERKELQKQNNKLNLELKIKGQYEELSKNNILN